MCSYLKALAAVRDWNPSHCSAVVCGPSFQVRHTQNQPSNKFICLFPKPKCPKRQRFIYRDWFGKHFLLIPWLVGCWISYPRAGRCQLRSTESHYYRHWRCFSKSQSWGAMTLGCHWVTVWAPMSYLYHPLCTLTPIHWFWWFIRPSMAKFQLCGCPLLPSSLNLASTCYIYIYICIYSIIFISIQFISYLQFRAARRRIFVLWKGRPAFGCSVAFAQSRWRTSLFATWTWLLGLMVWPCWPFDHRPGPLMKSQGIGAVERT